MYIRKPGRIEVWFYRKIRGMSDQDIWSKMIGEAADRLGI